MNVKEATLNPSEEGEVKEDVNPGPSLPKKEDTKKTSSSSKMTEEEEMKWALGAIKCLDSGEDEEEDDGKVQEMVEWAMRTLERTKYLSDSEDEEEKNKQKKREEPSTADCSENEVVQNNKVICKPVSVVLTRLTDKEIQKWTQRPKKRQRTNKEGEEKKQRKKKDAAVCEATEQTAAPDPPKVPLGRIRVIPVERLCQQPPVSEVAAPPIAWSADSNTLLRNLLDVSPEPVSQENNQAVLGDVQNTVNSVPMTATQQVSVKPFAAAAAAASRIEQICQKLSLHQGHMYTTDAAFIPPAATRQFLNPIGAVSSYTKESVTADACPSFSGSVEATVERISVIKRGPKCSTSSVVTNPLYMRPGDSCDSDSPSTTPVNLSCRISPVRHFSTPEGGAHSVVSNVTKQGTPVKGNTASLPAIPASSSPMDTSACLSVSHPSIHQHSRNSFGELSSPVMAPPRAQTQLSLEPPVSSALVPRQYHGPRHALFGTSSSLANAESYVSPPLAHRSMWSPDYVTANCSSPRSDLRQRSPQSCRSVESTNSNVTKGSLYTKGQCPEPCEITKHPDSAAGTVSSPAKTMSMESCKSPDYVTTNSTSSESGLSRQSQQSLQYTKPVVTKNTSYMKGLYPGLYGFSKDPYSGAVTGSSSVKTMSMETYKSPDYVATHSSSPMTGLIRQSPQSVQHTNPAVTKSNSYMKKYQQSYGITEDPYPSTYVGGGSPLKTKSMETPKSPDYITTNSRSPMNGLIRQSPQSVQYTKDVVTKSSSYLQRPYPEAYGIARYPYADSYVGNGSPPVKAMSMDMYSYLPPWYPRPPADFHLSNPPLAYAYNPLWYPSPVSSTKTAPNQVISHPFV